MVALHEPSSKSFGAICAENGVRPFAEGQTVKAAAKEVLPLRMEEQHLYAPLMQTILWSFPSVDEAAGLSTFYAFF